MYIYICTLHSLCTKRANSNHSNKPLLLSIYLMLAKSLPDFYRNSQGYGITIIILKEEDSINWCTLKFASRHDA